MSCCIFLAACGGAGFAGGNDSGDRSTSAHDCGTDNASLFWIAKDGQGSRSEAGARVNGTPESRPDIGDPMMDPFTIEALDPEIREVIIGYDGNDPQDPIYLDDSLGTQIHSFDEFHGTPVFKYLDDSFETYRTYLVDKQNRLLGIDITSRTAAWAVDLGPGDGDNYGGLALAGNDTAIPVANDPDPNLIAVLATNGTLHCFIDLGEDLGIGGGAQNPYQSVNRINGYNAGTYIFEGEEIWPSTEPHSVFSSMGKADSGFAALDIIFSGFGHDPDYEDVLCYREYAEFSTGSNGPTPDYREDETAAWDTDLNTDLWAGTSSNLRLVSTPFTRNGYVYITVIDYEKGLSFGSPTSLHWFDAYVLKLDASDGSYVARTEVFPYPSDWYDDSTGDILDVPPAASPIITPLTSVLLYVSAADGVHVFDTDHNTSTNIMDPPISNSNVMPVSTSGWSNTVTSYDIDMRTMPMAISAQLNYGGSQINRVFCITIENAFPYDPAKAEWRMKGWITLYDEMNDTNETVLAWTSGRRDGTVNCEPFLDIYNLYICEQDSGDTSLLHYTFSDMESDDDRFLLVPTLQTSDTTLVGDRGFSSPTFSRSEAFAYNSGGEVFDEHSMILVASDTTPTDGVALTGFQRKEHTYSIEGTVYVKYDNGILPYAGGSVAFVRCTTQGTISYICRLDDCGMYRLDFIPADIDGDLIVAHGFDPMDVEVQDGTGTALTAGEISGQPAYEIYSAVTPNTTLSRDFILELDGESQPLPWSEFGRDGGNSRFTELDGPTSATTTESINLSSATSLAGFGIYGSVVVDDMGRVFASTNKGQIAQVFIDPGGSHYAIEYDLPPTDSGLLNGYELCSSEDAHIIPSTGYDCSDLIYTAMRFDKFSGLTLLDIQVVLVAYEKGSGAIHDYKAIDGDLAWCSPVSGPDGDVFISTWYYPPVGGAGGAGSPVAGKLYRFKDDLSASETRNIVVSSANYQCARPAAFSPDEQYLYLTVGNYLQESSGMQKVLDDSICHVLEIDLLSDPDLADMTMLSHSVERNIATNHPNDFFGDPSVSPSLDRTVYVCGDWAAWKVDFDNATVEMSGENSTPLFSPITGGLAVASYGGYEYVYMVGGKNSNLVRILTDNFDDYSVSDPDQYLDFTIPSFTSIPVSTMVDGSGNAYIHYNGLCLRINYDDSTPSFNSASSFDGSSVANGFAAIAGTGQLYFLNSLSGSAYLTVVY
ncbi:hypothetical protein KDL44_05950 [bacterium]|nr:hypothetical protein [bacterium]